MVFNDCMDTTGQIIYEISVFARGVNSTMKRMGALQWPESVLAGNPYSGTMLKHIKTFCIILFCVAPIPSSLLGRKVYTARVFWAILVEILGSFQKSSRP